MDDYKIADDKSIEMMNNEYKKIISSYNISSLSFSLSDNNKKDLAVIFDSTNKEKAIIEFFNNKLPNNSSTSECLKILDASKSVIDKITSKYNIDYKNNSYYKNYHLKELFELHFFVVKSVNCLQRNTLDKWLLDMLNKIKTNQIDVLLLMLPFLI